MNLFRGLSPFGPIFGKELRVAARRRRNYLLRVAYLGGLLLFLIFAWTITNEQYRGNGGVAQRAQQQQQLGFFFFAFFSMFCGGAMALIGPVLTSTAINGERQAKTLHVLLMTPITAWQIVSGKLLSRMLTALTLIGLSLPVLALVRLLGGVELDQMFGVVSLCAVIALTGAALGLLLSIILRRAFAVIILSYLIAVVVYLFAPILTVALMQHRLGRLPWMNWLAGYNPFWQVGFLGWGQMRMLTMDWRTCVIGHLVASAVLLVASAFLVRRLARREGEGATPAPTEALPPIALGPAEPTVDMAAPAPVVVSKGRRARANRTVSDHPVLWREQRRPLMTRRWQRLVGTIFCSGLLVLAYCAAAASRALDDKGFHGFMGCCFYTLVMLITCVIAATSIAQEKEGETWTVLLASPLSGWAIVWGKALGVLRRLMWPMVLVAAHFLVFMVMGVLSPVEMIIGISVTAMFNALWVASGVAFSLRLRKVTTAVIANMALPIALYGGGTLVLAVIDALVNAHGDLTENVTWYLPYFYLIEGIGYGHASRRMREFPAINERVALETFAAVALFVGFLHVLLAGGILAWTAHRFNRFVARAPQLDPLEKPAPQSGVSWAAAGR